MESVIIGRPYKYTEEEFEYAVKSSYSLRGVLKMIGLQPAGGNYETAKRRIKKLNLDISHFTGQGHLNGKTHNWTKSKSLDEILVNDSSYSNTSKLRKRLIKCKIFEEKCYNCGKTLWLGEPIPLELEHKNGVKTDNRLENLTLLCPNCHAFTDTYRGKNINGGIRKKTQYKYRGAKRNRATIGCVKICPVCSKEFYVKKKVNEQVYCSRKCWQMYQRKVERPDRNILKKEITNNSWLALGRKYGVSGNSVRNWAKRYKLL